jgi:large subunit ribosomal protein L4
MVSVPVFESATGNKLEPVSFEEAKLGGVVKTALMRDAILTYEANQHQGTHSAKNLSEVAGSNHKPWRQKGTGRARAGHKRSPLWRGGAVVHGPRPRDVKRKMPRKARQSATRSALLAKCLDGGVMLLDALQCPEIKTKQIEALLNRLDLFDTVLLVTDPFNEVVWKSARNILGVKVLDVQDLNTFDVLVPKRVLMEKQTFLKLLATQSPTSRGEMTAEPDQEQGMVEATVAGGNAEPEPAQEQGGAGSPSEGGETEQSE